MRPVSGILLALATGLSLLAAPAAATAAPAPPGPVFADGQAQPVFDPTDVVRQSLWVRAPVDSDADGQPDEMYVEVVRPRATEDGLRVPVVYMVSPYFAGGNDITNHDVDVELYLPPGPHRPGSDRGGSRHTAAGDERLIAAGVRAGAAGRAGGPAAAPIVSRYEPYFIARGFAMVYAESLGSGLSTGCPTSGGRNETIGAKSIVDWLNGRASGHDAAGQPVRAGWATGKVGMMGVSYNGTLPNAVATTGVRGLEAIVPIGAISNWYDYYRTDGAVVAPGTFQGEDLDVLAEFVYTRADRQICRPVIDNLAREQDRVTGDFSRFWAERDYLPGVRNVRAAVLVAHGLNDWNVKSRQFAQWYQALADQGTPHQIWLHQFAHTDPVLVDRDGWLRTLNRWFTRYLYGVRNGVERDPRATVQREDMSWSHEAEWPAPGSSDASLWVRPGGSTAGGLTTAGPAPARAGVERLTDDATILAETLAAAPTSPHRLVYRSPPAAAPVRVSGTGRVGLTVAFDRPAANVTTLLIDQAPDGSQQVITRGWADPQNRTGISRTVPVRPGRSYRLDVLLQPKDYVLPAGHRFVLAVLSSDFDYTLRPRPGTRLTVTLAGTSLVLPAVGGRHALRVAFG
ncbi:MAG TPA: Xaa-Pro dipeptidyl-peptidase [Mycobacteriales bacterium]|nr:Xaa-Pro dipeptidyl-peptidase [Mycobacteriales bacterium]